MKKRNLRSNSSGQVIIITALLVASLLLSTAVYVIETEKEVPTVDIVENNAFPAYKQSTTNTLISALANVTNGGEANVLTDDLNKLNSAITSDSYQASIHMSCTPLNVAPYQNGVWISWGADGQGVSSAYVSFAFNSSGVSTTSNIEYALNVTSEANLRGNCRPLDGTSEQANLTVNLFNEGKPALAEGFAFYFENSTASWVKVISPDITDFGNGTYSVSFTTETDQSSTPLLVSMLCQDQRGISIETSVICANTG